MRLKTASELRFKDFDSFLFDKGAHHRVYEKLGAHPCMENGTAGTLFQVWAPSARYISLIGDFNDWKLNAACMNRTSYGVWELFVPGVTYGCAYKYAILGADGLMRYKSDPYGFRMEMRPATGSVVEGLRDFPWTDSVYLERFTNKTVADNPMAIYEIHPGYWKKDYSTNENGFPGYRRLADELSEYVEQMGFTHVELVGISEHALDASWGYQVTGFFAPTSRYGTPSDFKYFVNRMHSKGIGVILDWVPAHFPNDYFGLEFFDGTPLYEYADPLRANYPEWGTKAFDHGRTQVQCFLISNALYWIREFHIDALRADAVAAMLSSSSFRRGAWRPNVYGGSENLESIAFLKKINKEIKSSSRGFLISGDASKLQGVTSDDSGVALGFLYKWNLHWINDALNHVKKEPVYRGWYHYQITHNADYAYNENYILVLAHNDVVHLRASLFERFPGKLMDRPGGRKALYAFMFTFPGKKLLFMGQEFANDHEWLQSREVDWYLADEPENRDVFLALRSLLNVYRKYPVLYMDSDKAKTIEWVNNQDSAKNTFSFIRRNPWNYSQALLVIINYSPLPCGAYTCGVPVKGTYRRIYSTCDVPANETPEQAVQIPLLLSEALECDGYPHRITCDLDAYEAAIYEFPAP